MTEIIKNKSHIKGKAKPFGASKAEQGIQFSCIIDKNNKCELMIYDKAHKLIDSVIMNDYIVCGSIASVIITEELGNDFTYSYKINGKAAKDFFMKNTSGIRRYGDFNASYDESRLYEDDFDWEGDEPLGLPYNKIIAYQFNVRGFTKHASSKVKQRGTFLGAAEKITYLRELGITQIVLMPCYEFDERIKMGTIAADKERINYWGFTEGSYYCPKASYSATGDPVNEFKTMIKAFHCAGIEVVMRMYFPGSVNPALIADILRFYVTDYHIDGFFLMGSDIPINVVSQDPMLSATKIYNAFFDKTKLKAHPDSVNKNLAYANGDFAVTCRRFLKSDENMLYDFIERQRLNPTDVHAINYITDYCGFTLNDLVSYDHKHNEDNGEDNRDGENFNYSWNCGCEGDTRRKAVVSLRLKQIKNAFAFLLLSQGVPMILSGDEFLNSQNGNNNPYCQDNETGWVVWKNNKQAAQIHDFVKKIIYLRNTHPILHPASEFRIMDYAACGFPDLSYHSESAWAPRFDNYLRHIGLMLCGYYAKDGKKEADDFFYIAYNMHWESHDFALPNLPKGLEWEILLLTDDESCSRAAIALKEDGTQKVVTAGRCVCILKSAEAKNTVSGGKEDKNVR